MVKIENKDFKVGIQLKSIELLKNYLQPPTALNTSNTSSVFNINIESRADASNKLVYITIHVEIKNEDQSIVLGTLSVGYIFEIINFEEVIKFEPDGKLNIQQPLIEILNSISISTTRGVMFSIFKGTFLHNALLPIIDPKQFQTFQLDVDK